MYSLTCNYWHPRYTTSAGNCWHPGYTTSAACVIGSEDWSLDEELAAWDRASDEALHNFEASLKEEGSD